MPRLLPTLSPLSILVLAAACGHVEPAAQAVAVQAVPAPVAMEEFFDDFSQASLEGLRSDGWSIRIGHGHPGIPGALWTDQGVQLTSDPDQPGNRLLRLHASTNGYPDGTFEAQVCQKRKFFEGTYAARVRLRDLPAQGNRGDTFVETFYAASPLRFDFDPQYSEVDWEYLPNGGWGDEHTRIYGVSWQTVRLDPWLAVNEPTQVLRSLEGWHVLVVQVEHAHTHWFLDGEKIAEHGGRNVPVVPMSIDFSIWVSPSGLIPGDSTVRAYDEDVDWVFHARNASLAPGEVLARVAKFRATGVSRTDTVPASDPPLASPCDM